MSCLLHVGAPFIESFWHVTCDRCLLVALLVPAGKASTSFHLQSELGDGLYVLWRDGLDCSSLWPQRWVAGGLVVARGICPTV